MTPSRRVLLYNSRLPNSNFHLAVSLWRACRETPGVEVETAQPDTLPLLLRAFFPDIVLAFGGEALTVEAVRAARQRFSPPGAVWALWTTEDPFEREVNCEVAPAFDVVFTSDQDSREAYVRAGQPNAHWLPLAGDEAFSYHPVVTDEDRLLYDLIFVGTAWPNRVAFFKELLTACREAGLRTRFVLPTNEHLSSETLEALGLPAFERDYRISPGDLARLQNRSRCALALFRDFSRFSGIPRPQTSPTNRFYETALAGTAQIPVSEVIDVARFYPELSGAVFQETTAEGVVARVLRARERPEERSEAARRVQEFVRSGHLYRHRLAELLSKAMP